MKHEAVETPNKDQTGFWKSNLRDYGLLGSLLVIIALFEYLTGGVLLAPVNITNLILQNSYIVIMALGMLLIIVGGNIDLSVGSIVGFIGAIAATMMVDYKMPWVPVVGISLVAGGLIGAAQGYFVAYAKIPSFIVTLGGMLVFRGLTGNILLGQFVGPFPKDFQSISSGFIPDVVSAPLLALFGDGIGTSFRWTSMLVGLVGAALLIFTSARRWRRAKAHTMETEPLALFIGKNAVFAILIVGFCYLLASYRGLPNVLIIMGALILLYMFVTQRMTIGRRIYALGGNRLAAQLSGIRTERLIFLTFVNMGALAGLAGLIVAARLNSATPSAGNSFELDVIAACFIGGASASGGVGKVMGVVIGAFVMGVMNNGMSILGIGIYWQYVVKGLVLLAAVYVDGYQKNKG
ncbi:MULTISPECIES: multiple monosaccharide ABC transporter permease [Bradyrhizobium]|uniref:Xylose transport system permease protein XylH n=2 Tax=Bradyrhizobium TaxID=374 RepID=A0ABY0PHN8_9BRAD|nr:MULTISPECIES: multiple monosaccharide ABC transporter permease [Bradyrhizobium]SDI40606.1 multiple monosaccharide ABC transporter membrane protein [Bradyrhizobium ottawaense]SED56365.1 multiple monosaccharide ABC transporter membrane protein [Bradyrhizobium lablabi]SHL55240.1 multiple monosaccharide ABC transporter membrane protein [Bradyrhizobium lablabi]